MTLRMQLKAEQSSSYDSTKISNFSYLADIDIKLSLI